MSIFEIRSFLRLAGYYRRYKIEDTWNTRDKGVGNKREEQLSPSSGKRQKTSASH